MQRAAARQLTWLVICPLRRHQTLLLNAIFLHPAAASADEILPPRHQLLHLHHLSRPSSLTVLRKLTHLSVRCLSHGSPLPSLIDQNSDGLPSTQYSFTDENSAHTNNDGSNCLLMEDVDVNGRQPSPNRPIVSVCATWSQDHQQGDISRMSEGNTGSPPVLLSDTSRQVVTKHVVLPSAFMDPHCTQSSKGNKVATFPSDAALQLHNNEGIGVRDHVVLVGTLPIGSGASCDCNEASSPSDIIPQDITDRVVKGIDLDSQSSLGNDSSTDSCDACARQSFEEEFGCLSDFLVDASSVSWILDKHGWGPHTESILQNFIGSMTPDLVADVVDEQKDAKVAFRFIEWAGKQENFQYREEIFTKVVGRLGKSSEYGAVWTVLEFMRKHGLKVNYAFGIFIHRLKSANMVDEVVKAMDSMMSLDVIPTVPLYTVAFQLILSANNFKDAQRLYVRMWQAGLQPDTKLFGILISGFAKAGERADALFFFEEMKRSGVPPDSLIYTSLIGAFAAVGQYSEGQKFYTEMVQNNCLPSVLSHVDLECALHGVSSMEQIQRFLEDLETRGHLISVHIYNSVLQHLLDNKMLMEAVEVFCRLLEEPQKWDSSQSLGKRAARPNADSYSILIYGLCKEGKLSEALLLFEKMLGNGFQSCSEVCNCLLHGLSSSEGFMYEAVELSVHIVRGNLIVDVETQKTFFRALHTGGYVSKARQIFEAMKWRGCIDRRSDFHALTGDREEGIIKLEQGKHIDIFCPCELMGVSLSNPSLQNKTETIHGPLCTHGQNVVV